MSKKSFNDHHFFMDRLHKYKNTPLFDVPEHYFDQLQHDVMQRVNIEIKRQKTFKKWFSAISAAASITLIITLACYIFVNRNTEEHFYVSEETTISDDSVISFDSSYYADANDFMYIEKEEIIVSNESPLKNEPSVTPNETIVYSAVEYYVDDYETEKFYETMYDLECYYDY